jgi:SNF2-related domain
MQMVAEIIFLEPDDVRPAVGELAELGFECEVLHWTEPCSEAMWILVRMIPSSMSTASPNSCSRSSTGSAATWWTLASATPTSGSSESIETTNGCVNKLAAEFAQMNAPLPRVLRSYQQRLATFLYEHDAAFAIAPLGAGKGAAALTGIAELIRDGQRRHALVIAPKLVATTVWPQEVASWPHLAHLRAAVLDGSPARRRALLAAAEREITVIGVDLVPWLVDELTAIPDGHPLFDALIIDETSRLKDPSGKRARALLKVAGRFRTRWGLTGTPRPNSAMDLFMPAAIITNGALWGCAFVPWQKRHFRLRDPFGREWIALPGAEEQIAADFGIVAMTVADADMPDLPAINVVVTRVELPPAAMATYKTMQQELFATIKDRSIEAVSALVATGKCAQLANGFVYGEDNDDPVEVHTAKIDWLKDLVETLDGEPLLIAYEFIEDLRAIWRAFGKVPALGGLTPAKEASRLIEAWNEGTLPLLAFHPASAAHGINLQFGGSRMAWLSPSWSAELTEQAIARIYRPGQMRHVTIHVCVATGTVDEMKRDRVLGKMSAQEAFKRHLERV